MLLPPLHLHCPPVKKQNKKKQTLSKDEATLNKDDRKKNPAAKRKKKTLGAADITPALTSRHRVMLLPVSCFFMQKADDNVQKERK